MEKTLSPLRVQGARHLGRAVGPANWIVYPAVALITGMAGDLSARHLDWLVGVIVSTAVLGLPRWLLGRQLLTAPAQALPRILRLYTVSVFLVAGCWSVFSCLAVSAYPGQWTSLLLVMVSAGITAGSTSGLNPSLPLQLGFIAIMMGPQTLAMAFSGGRAVAIASLTSAVFALFVARTGIINHRQFVSWLVANRDLKLAHEQLAQTLEQEKIQREHICLLEERWSFAFQGSGDGVWDWNPLSGEVYYSHRLHEILGLPEDARNLTMETWFERIAAEDSQSFQQALQDHLQGRSELFVCENRLRKEDGSTCWTLARGKVVERDETGRARRVVGTCTNIDEQKQLQIQLSLARNLESIGQLAAGIAHEINTPIQYVSDNVAFLRGACDQLMEAVEAGNKPEELDYLREELPAAFDQTTQGVAHIAKIVSAMREFTHSGQGDRRPIDLNRLIENSLILCRSRLRYIGEVSTELNPNLPDIPVVQSELSQVLLNLLVNAADAVVERQQSEPEVRGKISVATRGRANCVEILVSDNGCGISPHQEHKIFDPFFTTKMVGKGTGQGLTLCRNIVRCHGGDIRFSSKPGSGTTFCISLPLQVAV